MNTNAFAAAREALEAALPAPRPAAYIDSTTPSGQAANDRPATLPAPIRCVDALARTMLDSTFGF